MIQTISSVIHNLTDPLQDEPFRIVLKPPTHQGFLLATAKVAWASQCNDSEHTSLGGVGVQFTVISPGDRQFLSNLT